MAHGHYNVDPGAVRSSLDFEIAAKLACARSDAKDANPGSERRASLILRHAFHAATIVSDVKCSRPAIRRKVTETCDADA